MNLGHSFYSEEKKISSLIIEDISKETHDKIIRIIKSKNTKELIEFFQEEGKTSHIIKIEDNQTKFLRDLTKLEEKKEMLSKEY